MAMGAPQLPDTRKLKLFFQRKNMRSYEKQFRKHWQKPIQLWQQLTIPKAPESGASTTQRERHRRAQLTSTVLFLLLVVALIVFPLTFFNALRTLSYIMLGSLLLTVLALILNRLGKTMLVGILMVTLFTSGSYLGLTLLFVPDGLTVSYLNNFDLLIEAELFAVSLLPAGYVFLVMCGNILFILANMFWQPHSQELTHMFVGNGFLLLALRPVMLQIFVAVVSYLWARSATQAFTRADEAEEIAQLEHTLAKQKLQLEQGVQQLSHTLIQAANGDLSARTPLIQDQLLWQVANSLNLLLSRLHHLESVEQDCKRLQGENEQLRGSLHKTMHLEKELSQAKRLADDYFSLSQQHAQENDDKLLQLKGEIALLVQAIITAKTKKQPIWSREHGTELDPLINNLRGNYLYPFSIPTHGQQITIVKQSDI
jgi:hypothetical protein